MNNLNTFKEFKNFNRYFFIYLAILSFCAVINLYIKHDVGNDSTISEWIINYQGGLTRRGFIGEICFQIARYFMLDLRFVIFIFQSTLKSKNGTYNHEIAKTNKKFYSDINPIESKSLNSKLEISQIRYLPCRMAS